MMNAWVDRLWKDRESDDTSVALRALLVLFAIKYILAFMTFLTQYPPFSWFWTNWFFHHQNRDILEARNRIREITEDLGGWFDVSAVERDPHFLRLVGKFEGLRRKRNREEIIARIADRLAEECIYLRVVKKDGIAILVNRQGA